MDASMCYAGQTAHLVFCRHVQPCPVFKLNLHSFEWKNGWRWEASMQAHHPRDARKTEDEFAETAKCACTSFFAEVMFDIARHGVISL